MNEDRHMPLHFSTGTKMEVSVPTQIKHSPAAVLEGVKRTMESDKLTLEADGRLTVVPWARVHQGETSPVPAALPFSVIEGARILKSDETKSA